MSAVDEKLINQLAAKIARRVAAQLPRPAEPDPHAFAAKVVANLPALPVAFPDSNAIAEMVADRLTKKQEPERYLTATELADRLSRHRETVYRWTRSGRVRSYLHGQEHRYLLSEVLEDLEKIDIESKKDR